MIFTNAFTTGIKFAFVFATSQDFALYMYADIMLCSSLTFLYSYLYYYRPPEGGRLYEMKVVSGYAFLRTYFV